MCDGRLYFTDGELITSNTILAMLVMYESLLVLDWMEDYPNLWHLKEDQILYQHTFLLTFLEIPSASISCEKLITSTSMERRQLVSAIASLGGRVVHEIDELVEVILSFIEKLTLIIACCFRLPRNGSGFCSHRGSVGPLNIWLRWWPIFHAFPLLGSFRWSEKACISIMSAFVYRLE